MQLREDDKAGTTAPEQSAAQKEAVARLQGERDEIAAELAREKAAAEAATAGVAAVAEPAAAAGPAWDAASAWSEPSGPAPVRSLPSVSPAATVTPSSHVPGTAVRTESVESAPVMDGFGVLDSLPPATITTSLRGGYHPPIVVLWY